MLLRGQESCLKHPMTITDTFKEKYFKVKYGSSGKLGKTLFFWKITMPGVSTILAAELTPRSIWGPGVLDGTSIYSLVARICEKTLWTQNFENRIFTIFHSKAYSSHFSVRNLQKHVENWISPNHPRCHSTPNWSFPNCFLSSWASLGQAQDPQVWAKSTQENPIFSWFFGKFTVRS